MSERRSEAHLRPAGAPESYVEQGGQGRGFWVEWGVRGTLHRYGKWAERLDVVGNAADGEQRAAVRAEECNARLSEAGLEPDVRVVARRIEVGSWQPIEAAASTGLPAIKDMAETTAQVADALAVLLGRQWSRALTAAGRGPRQIAAELVARIPALRGEGREGIE